MPELPEVEAARQIIADKCLHKTIQKVEIPQEDEKVFDGSTAAELVAALQGQQLDFVGRRGKQLWLRLSGDGPMPLIHFGMTGFIAVQEASGAVHTVAYENSPKDNTSAWPPRFLKLLLHFGPPSDPCQLAFCDARRFGRVKLVAGDPAASEPVTKLGWDPLLEMPGLKEFEVLLAARGKRGTRLKPLLLDQSFCAGVGNWVGDEVLYQARLHPEQLVSALQLGHVKALHSALREVVTTAVAANADSSRFPPGWMFHVRWGKKQGRLAGHPLAHITVGSRTSCFVPALQKLIGGSVGDGNQQPAGKHAKKRKAAGSSKNKAEQQQEEEQESDEAEQQQQEEPLSDRPSRAAAPRACKRSRAAAGTSGKQQKEAEAAPGGGAAAAAAAAARGPRPKRAAANATIRSSKTAAAAKTR